MTTKKRSTESAEIRTSRLSHVRITQNFLLVWLDKNIDEDNNDDYRNTIIKLRQVINTINTFTDIDGCIDFINGIKNETIFMITSGVLGQIIVPIVHDQSQIGTIYIFCGNKKRHEEWTQQWSKVKGIFTDIEPICEALKQAAQDCDQNMISISFVKSNDSTSKENLDQLDQSFMYTQILKEIILTIDFEQDHINEFLSYCREQFDGNSVELANVEKLFKEYRLHEPIWWYTYDCFLYSMLNRALRMMEIDLITKMGFFIQDLHNHIATLHTEQFNVQDDGNLFTVYRGQGLFRTDFEQLMKTQGGLLSFNNFLSTSKNRDVSLAFARQITATSNLVGILFVMEIDPSMSTTPFANVSGVSYFQTEEEILFSMHAVFRIGQAKEIDTDNDLWKVQLILTSDNDPQLNALTEHIREETSSTYKGWDPLGRLIIKLGHFNKAEELYKILLQQPTTDSEKSHIYHMLGMVKSSQGVYTDAIEFYEKSIDITQKISSSTNPNLTASYNNLGAVYDKMGEYIKALSYYEKALEISQKTLSPNHSDLATSYNNIGLVYSEMGEYSKALSYYERALEIDKKTLPSNHPDLATSYNNIGSLYDKMGDCSKALSYYEKDLEISQKTLPSNHPDLACSYNNIGI